MYLKKLHTTQNYVGKSLHTTKSLFGKNLLGVVQILCRVLRTAQTY